MKKRGLLAGAALLLLLMSGCSKQPDQFDELINDTITIKNGGIVLRNIGWFKSEEKAMKAYNADQANYESNKDSGTARATVYPVLEDLEDSSVEIKQVMTFSGDRLYRMEYFISTNSSEEYLDCLDSLADQLEDVIPDGESKDALDFDALESGSGSLSWTASDDSSITVYPFEISGDPAYMIILVLNPPVVEELPPK